MPQAQSTDAPGPWEKYAKPAEQKQNEAPTGPSEHGGTPVIDFSKYEGKPAAAGGTPVIDFSKYERGPWEKYAKPAEPAAATGTISAIKPGAESWLERLQGDIRHGSDTTGPGKLLNKIPGWHGISGGVPESVSEFMGGPMIGPVTAAHGAATLASGNGPLWPRIRRGTNEIVRGAAQTATLPLAVAAPGILPQLVPSMALYGAANRGVEGGAAALGADPDTAEFAANLATLAIPGIKAGMPRAGRFLERNAAPIGKAAGYGLGAYEAAKTGNPLWLLTGSRRATALAADAARYGGRGLQAVGETPLLPHELIKAPLRPTLRTGTPAGALPRGHYEAPASQLRNPAQLGEGVHEGEYMPMEEPPPRGAPQLPRGPIPARESSVFSRPQLGEARVPQMRTFKDTLDDRIVQDVMRDNLAREGAGVDAKARREFADRNSMDKPKWLVGAEARAQAAADKILREAEEQAHRPVRFTLTPPSRTKFPYPPATPPEQLGSVLEESIRRAKAAKQKP